MSVEVCCDFCGKQIPIEQVDFDDGFGPTDCICIKRTKELNTRKLFPQLCESCADKLDEVVRLARETWLKEIDIAHRNQTLNDVRRSLLGSKG